MKKIQQTITLNILVKPNAKKTEIYNLTNEEITIRLQAIAKDGKANSELKDYLSTILKVKKSDISILRGEKSKEKIVSVQNTTEKEIQENLSKEFT
eukprot:gene11106-3813_t